VPHAICEAVACAAIIPLVPARYRIQQPTRGFYRAGRPLPSIWPCTTRGFSVPAVLPPERWALTPLFTPAKRREHFVASRKFSSGSHRASLRRRSILCGTFRSLSRTASGETRRHTPKRVTLLAADPCVGKPLAYQARCPVKSSADHSSPPSASWNMISAASGRCPDFPPDQPILRSPPRSNGRRRLVYARPSQGMLGSDGKSGHRPRHADQFADAEKRLRNGRRTLTGQRAW